MGKEKSPRQEKGSSTSLINGKTGQYLGVIMMVLAFILAAFIVHASGSDYFTENIIMTILMGLGIVLSTLGYLTVAIVVCAASVIVYAGVKIYSLAVVGSDFAMVAFLWIVLPVMSLGGIGLFLKSYSDLLLENALLKKQVSELVMIDPVTGLYNTRSMFTDLQKQISYSERNGNPLSLMIVRLRYPNEMKKVLKKHEFEMVIKQLSVLLVDTVRLEDKVYRIDGDCVFAIVLTTDKNGTKIVEKRLRGKLEEPKWFENVSAKHQVRAEVKLGYLQYDNSIYNRDANSFMQAVEEEVEYDI